MTSSRKTPHVQYSYRSGENDKLDQGLEQSESARPHGMLRRFFGRMDWTHGWFCFWSIGSIALLICVLMGCSSPSVTNYALLWIPSGEGDVTPEVFIGLSGMCVTFNVNNLSCFGQFPYHFNQKIVNGVLTDIQPDEYITPISKASGDPVPLLAIVLASLLIFSIFLSTVSIAISLSRESGFSKHVVIAAVPDLLVMICCAVIVGMVVYGYPTTWAAPQFHIGAYLMYAAFGARVLSHPIVMKVFLKLCSAPLKMCLKTYCNGSMDNPQPVLPLARIDNILPQNTIRT